TTQADTFYGSVPCTRSLTEEEIKGSYEREKGNVNVETFYQNGINPNEIPSVLVYSHGPFAWGKNAKEALHHAVILEEVCKMAYHTLNLNPTISSMDQHLLDKHYLRKHGAYAYYGQN
ncbi:class II aldolase/adducin family protein, partial [Streptococcus hyovaginalis]